MFPPQPPVTVERCSISKEIAINLESKGRLWEGDHGLWRRECSLWVKRGNLKCLFNNALFAVDGRWNVDDKDDDDLEENAQLHCSVRYYLSVDSPLSFFSFLLSTSFILFLFLPLLFFSLLSFLERKKVAKFCCVRPGISMSDKADRFVYEVC